MRGWMLTSIIEKAVKKTMFGIIPIVLQVIGIISGFIGLMLYIVDYDRKEKRK